MSGPLQSTAMSEFECVLESAHSFRVFLMDRNISATCTNPSSNIIGNVQRDETAVRGHLHCWRHWSEEVLVGEGRDARARGVRHRESRLSPRGIDWPRSSEVRVRPPAPVGGRVDGSSG